MIGKRLRQLLASNNMTQAELCRKLSISPGNMSNFINDQRNPSLETLSLIAGYFSVNLDSFVNEHSAVKVMPKTLTGLTENALISSSRLWIRIDSDSFAPAFSRGLLIYTDIYAEVAHRDCILIFRNEKPELYRFLEKGKSSILIPFMKTEMPVEIKKQGKTRLYKIIYSAFAP